MLEYISTLRNFSREVRALGIVCSLASETLNKIILLASRLAVRQSLRPDFFTQINIGNIR
jgi:hypothetical protein